jgi:trigger factor
MYHKTVLVEEINKILGESVGKYLVDEKLNILGEPLPNEDKLVQVNWDQDTDFEFSFDIGLAPQLDILVSEKDKLPYYHIKVDEAEIGKQRERICSRFGSFKDADMISGNELIKADLTESDKKGEPVENGIRIEDASISLEVVKDEKTRKKFNGCKVDDEVMLDVKKAFENETDLAALLRVDKARLAEISSNFKVRIKSISRFELPEINQALFDQVYGADKVKSLEEFNVKIEEELKSAFERNSNYKFRMDAKDYYIKNFGQELPSAFLKRWLLHTNQGKLNLEQIEQDFDHFVVDLKWQLIKGKVVRDYDIKVNEEELIIHVMDVFRQQFVQYYGVAKYARESLSREEERNRYVESHLENKVFEFIQKTVKLDTKELTLEKFNKMFEK